MRLRAKGKKVCLMIGLLIKRKNLLELENYFRIFDTFSDTFVIDNVLDNLHFM